MAIASIPVKRTIISSRYINALLWGNILIWLFTVPRALVSGVANHLIGLLPKTHFLFEIFGQIRLLLSFISGLVGIATIHAQYTLEQRIAYSTKSDLFNQ